MKAQMDEMMKEPLGGWMAHGGPWWQGLGVLQ